MTSDGVSLAISSKQLYQSSRRYHENLSTVWFYCRYDGGFIVCLLLFFLTGKGEFGRLHNYYWNNHQIKSLRLVEYSMSCVNLELGQQWHRASMESGGQSRELWITVQRIPQIALSCLTWAGLHYPTVFLCIYSETWWRQHGGKPKKIWLSSQAKARESSINNITTCRKSWFYRMWRSTFLLESVFLYTLEYPTR